MTNWNQFKALTKKNFTVWKKQYTFSFLEIFLCAFVTYVFTSLLTDDDIKNFKEVSFVKNETVFDLNNGAPYIT